MITPQCDCMCGSDVAPITAGSSSFDPGKDLRAKDIAGLISPEKWGQFLNTLVVPSG